VLGLPRRSRHRAVRSAEHSAASASLSLDSLGFLRLDLEVQTAVVTVLWNKTRFSGNNVYMYRGGDMSTAASTWEMVNIPHRTLYA